MGSKELIDGLKEGVNACIAALEVRKQEEQSKLGKLDELSSAVADEVKAANEAGFEEGLKQAGQAGGSDKIYSDAEVNKFIADAKAPLEARVNELSAGAEVAAAQIAAGEAKVAELQAAVDGIDQKVADAVAAVKSADDQAMADAQAKAQAEIDATKKSLDDMTAKEQLEEQAVADVIAKINQVQAAFDDIRAKFPAPAPAPAPAPEPEPAQ